MRGTGWEGEGRRDQEDLGTAAGETAVQLREAEIVAHGEPERADLGRDRDDLAARRPRFRFTDAHASGDVDIEEMELPVATDQFPVRGEEAARVERSRLPGHALEERAGAEMNAELTRERPEGRGGGTGNPLGVLVLLRAGSAPGEHFREDDQPGTALGSLPHQFGRPGEIDRPVRPRGHLHGCGDVGLHGLALGLSPGPPEASTSGVCTLVRSCDT